MYVVRTMAAKREITDPQAIDGFTALTVLSVAKEINRKRRKLRRCYNPETNVNDESIISQSVNALCFQLIENQFDFVLEPIHPFIYCNLLIILTPERVH